MGSTLKNLLGCWRFMNSSGQKGLFFLNYPVLYSDENVVNVFTRMNSGTSFHALLEGILKSVSLSTESKVLLRERYYLDFRLYKIDDPKNQSGVINLFSKNYDELVLRVQNAEELEAFISVDNLTSVEKADRHQKLLTGVSGPRYTPQTIQTSAGKVTVPANSSGLAPDYASLANQTYNGKDIIYNGSDGITKIQLTGVRDLDFQIAYEAMGITDSATIKAIEKKYVWHHADFDPLTGQGQMQLVLRDLHDTKLAGNTFVHTGGAGEWSLFYGITYR